MQLDETVDVWSATAACAACTARFSNLVTASCACIDTSSNRVIVDRMAVANQHAFFIPARSCKSNSIMRSPKTSMISMTKNLLSGRRRLIDRGIERSQACFCEQRQIGVVIGVARGEELVAKKDAVRARHEAQELRLFTQRRSPS